MLLMRFKFLHRLLLVTIITSPLSLVAQIDDIYDVRESAPSSIYVPFRPEFKTRNFENSRYSTAQERYRRDTLRQSRNSLSISGGVTGSLTAMNEAWIDASGGDNTIGITAAFDLEHKYTYKLFAITNKISARFGYNRIGVEITDDDGAVEDVPTWFKNQDEITLTTNPSIKISDNWSYGLTGTFRSQFASGYVSRTQQESKQLKSSFMSPGYLDISGGMTYNLSSEKWPFKFTLSPIAMSAIYVTNDRVIDNILYQYSDHIEDNYKYSEPYGIDPYLHSKYEGGFSLQVDFQRYLDKRKIVELTTQVYSFYGWITELTQENIYGDYDRYQSALESWSSDQTGVKPTLSIRPTVRWESTLKVKATDYFSTTITYKLYYNRSMDNNLQMQTYVDVGVIYTFKS